MSKKILFLIIISTLTASCSDNSSFKYSWLKKLPTNSTDDGTNNSTDGEGGSGGGSGITSGILKVVTGDDHTCALTDDSKVFCSGDNGEQQVAAGLVTANYNIVKPIDVTSTFGGLTPIDITVEYDSSCAVFSNGTAKCWGDNNSGELGVGHTNEVGTPEAILFFDGTSDAKKIKTLRLGEYIACALSEADVLYCWGKNTEFIFDSQTDPGDPTQPLIQKITSPMLMTDFDGSTPAKTVKDFRMGYSRACVLSMSDEFKCFGYNRDDLLGNTYSATFNLFFGMDGSSAANKVNSFSLGYGHACFITAEQKVMCWGNNSNGKLGCGQDDGALSNSSLPCQVVNSDDSDLLAQTVSVGDYQTCAITLDSKVKCWGRGSDGAIGNGLFSNQHKAQTVIKPDGSDLSDVAYLNSGLEAGHVCAITSSGALYCWGDNGDGQLLSGSNNEASSPRLMPLSSIASMGKGYGNDSNSCYVKTNGAVVCSDNYNFINGPLLTTPIDGSAGNQAVSITHSNNGGCAVLSNGGLNCWDSSLTAGSVAYFDSSNADHTAQKATKIAFTSTCVLANNKVHCDSDYTISVLNNVIDIAANDNYLCAVHTDNSVKCYANGVWGTPIPIVNLAGVGDLAVKVSISNNVGCALTQAGKVSCWPFDLGGENNYGLLGDGTVSSGPVNYFTANTVNVIDGITKVANKVEVGNEHACTQLAGGDIYCWGNNRNYQVSGVIIDPASYYVTEPAKVLNLPVGENFTLNVLGHSTCVVGDTTGALYCWGDTFYAGLTEDFDMRSKATLISL